MADPFPSPPGTNPPRHVQQQPASTASIVAVIAGILLLLGFTVWVTELAGNPTGNPAASNAPAVLATPAAGVPSPAPEATTGRAERPAESR